MGVGYGDRTKDLGKTCCSEGGELWMVGIESYSTESTVGMVEVICAEHSPSV